MLIILSLYVVLIWLVIFKFGNTRGEHFTSAVPAEADMRRFTRLTNAFSKKIDTTFTWLRSTPSGTTTQHKTHRLSPGWRRESLIRSGQ